MASTTGIEPRGASREETRKPSPSRQPSTLGPPSSIPAAFWASGDAATTRLILTCRYAAPI